MNEGYIQLQRTETTRELMEHASDAFMLITLIALRAKRSEGVSITGLEAGESLIGDHTKCGLTARTYRTSKSKLEKWKLVSFKATSRGTVARLLDTRVYDINLEESDKQETNERQTSDKQETTNNKDNNNNNSNGDDLKAEFAELWKLPRRPKDSRKGESLTKYITRRKKFSKEQVFNAWTSYGNDRASDNRQYQSSLFKFLSNDENVSEWKDTKNTTTSNERGNRAYSEMLNIVISAPVQSKDKPLIKTILDLGLTNLQNKYSKSFGKEKQTVLNEFLAKYNANVEIESSIPDDIQIDGKGLNKNDSPTLVNSDYL